MVKVVAKL